MDKEIAIKIEEFIKKLVAGNMEGAEITNETNLFENCLVDSLFVIDLILYLEETVLNRELNLKHYSRNDFNTINKCIAVITRELDK